MAAEAPISDVLCEAMEYLSKLGTNLKTRTENLKERKISKDKLRNAHAVQKAVSKVLLICELSKKSLENVEKEVKKIQKRVDCSQAPVDGGKNVKGDEKKYSFKYRSQTLKIASKIPIKHYYSTKVQARKMSVAVQDKYPVYYDCKLYRQRRKLEKKKSENERKTREISSEKLIEPNNEGNKDNAVEKEITQKSNISDKAYSDDCNEQNGNKNETSEEHVPNSIRVEEVSNKSLDNDNVLTENEQANAVEIEKDSATNSDQQIHDTKDSQSKEIRTKSKVGDKMTKIPKSKQNLERIVMDSDSHTENLQDDKSQEATENKAVDLIPTDKNMDEINKSPPHKKRKLPFMFESESDCDTSPVKPLDSDNEKGNHDNSKAKSDGEEKGPESNLEDVKEPNVIDLDDTNTKDSCESKSDVGPTKPLIKCVSLSKLLKPSTNLVPDIPIVQKLYYKHKPNSKIKEKNNKSLSQLTVRKLFLDRKEQLLKKKSTEEDYWKRKRKEVRSFKLKEFNITLCQLPKLSDELLNLHNIKRITQGGSVVCALSNVNDYTKEDDISNVKKALLHDSDTNDSENNPSNPDQIQNRKKGYRASKDTTDGVSLQTTEQNQTKEDKILSDENENIKSALLNDSDSDQNIITNSKSELQRNPENGINQSDGSQKEQEHSPTKIKQALLISSEDSDKSEIDKRKQKIEKRLQTNRKRIMESMEAKKMLLKYSSSSEDEENKKKSDTDAKKHHKRNRKKSRISSSSESTKYESDKHSSSKKVSTKETADNDAEGCKKNAKDSEQSDISSGKVWKSNYSY